MANYSVTLQSGFRGLGEYWCRTCLDEKSYRCEQHSDNEDLWLFEKQIDADNFNICIKKYCETAEAVGVPGP